MLHVPKASSRARTYAGIRRLMQERSLSGVAHVPSPLATEPAFWPKREPTWERSPVCVPSARDATARHPPTTATCGRTRELPLDVFPLHQKLLRHEVCEYVCEYAYFHGTSLFRICFITSRLCFLFIVSPTKM